jgi:hypothetical protein
VTDDLTNGTAHSWLYPFREYARTKETAIAKIAPIGTSPGRRYRPTDKLTAEGR